MKPSTRKAKLQALIAHHKHLYHVKDAPEIADEVYDSLIEELRTLEGTGEDEHSGVSTEVGDRPSEAFSKVEHRVRQWSFGNVFSDTELQDWEDKLKRHLQSEDYAEQDFTYVAEHKIDGLKLVLEYQKGVLVRAATRGDGTVGEDVTHTARTIKDVPQTLAEPVDMICVGEVWLGEQEFERINTEREKNDEALFANPRNAAAGSLRQLDAEITRQRNLSLFVYDIDWFDPKRTSCAVPETQWEELDLLKTLGCTVNTNNARCQSVSDIIAFHSTWQDKKDTLTYGVDGVVIKVNEVSVQRALGYTAKAPRFGVAYKFKAEQATTVVEDIQLQVGRTGAVTPVAYLRPVLIDGSTVARATLHNEDQITRLDVRVGDTIVLQKAGDIIPEITEVIQELRPVKTKPFRFPKKVPGCGGDGAIERVPGEAAYRCVTLDSDFLHRQRLYHFVSKGALNIDGVGPRIIDALLDAALISNHFDLFTLTAADIEQLPGFKTKAAENVVAAITARRTIPLHRLLIALSIDHVGEETARLIADRCGDIATVKTAGVATLAAIHGVGDIVAAAVVAWFSDADNRASLDHLLKHIQLTAPTGQKKTSLSGQTVVFTGTLATLTRDEAKELARAAGATVSSSVSKQTSYVVAGSEAGSKAEKAKVLGVTILSESDFKNLVS